MALNIEILRVDEGWHEMNIEHIGMRDGGNRRKPTDQRHNLGTIHMYENPSVSDGNRTRFTSVRGKRFERSASATVTIYVFTHTHICITYLTHICVLVFMSV